MAMFNNQRVFPSHSKGLYRTAAASSGHNKVMIHNEQDAAVQVCNGGSLQRCADFAQVAESLLRATCSFSSRLILRCPRSLRSIKNPDLAPICKVLLEGYII